MIVPTDLDVDMYIGNCGNENYVKGTIQKLRNANFAIFDPNSFPLSWNTCGFFLESFSLQALCNF